MSRMERASLLYSLSDDVETSEVAVRWSDEMSPPTNGCTR